MHEIQRPAGGFVAWKMCENTHTMDAPGCAGEASMWGGGGGGANLPPPPPSDLGRGARDRREILHKYRG